MASIVNDLKKIQRVSSVVIRAIERCFQNFDISLVSSEYSYGEFTIKLDVRVFDGYEIDADLCNKNAKDCARLFINRVIKCSDDMINGLDKEEKRYRREVDEYRDSYTDASPISLSSALMFKQIIENIKV
ncbi:hypothetical protein [Oceanospirillum maris]|uniref:hypothetical protein n=1 Tax=Oceanospirillum maris TaxID=64977 RepID=UPI0004855E77|nr:hypothetical protein [Oceanospirillum maris]